MIFDFVFDPIEKVHPWGTNFHWFALTQGSYRLKVGNEYLLNYTDEFIKYLSEKYPQYNNPATAFTDYYVVRLWEDILEILPAILEPVPKELQNFLNSDYENYQVLHKCADDWRETEIAKKQEEDQIYETADFATFWLSERWFDSAYLSPSAGIWIWSDETDVIISWDNSKIEIEGVSVWTAVRGNHRIDKNLFIKEIYDFNKRLFEQMDQRIESICQNWKNDEIKIDFEELKSEQNNRATWFNRALKSIHQTDWNKVMFAINQISEEQQFKKNF